MNINNAIEYLDNNHGTLTDKFTFTDKHYGNKPKKSPHFWRNI